MNGEESDVKKQVRQFFCAIMIFDAFHFELQSEYFEAFVKKKNESKR
jgi:hypothetical protein